MLNSCYRTRHSADAIPALTSNKQLFLVTSTISYYLPTPRIYWNRISVLPFSPGIYARSFLLDSVSDRWLILGVYNWILRFLGFFSLWINCSEGPLHLHNLKELNMANSSWQVITKMFWVPLFRNWMRSNSICHTTSAHTVVLFSNRIPSLLQAKGCLIWDNLTCTPRRHLSINHILFLLEYSFRKKVHCGVSPYIICSYC